MASSLGIADLTDAVLIRHFGEATFERGHGYADQGRARVLTSTPGSLVGTAVGSNGRRYTCRVLWAHRGPGSLWVSGTCTCPVLEDCKHCVALVLAARPEAGSAGSGGSRTDWRRALTPLLTAAEAPVVGHRSIALAFDRSAVRGYWGTKATLRVRPMITGRNGRWIKTGAAWSDLASPYVTAAGQDLNAQHREVVRALGRPLTQHANRHDGTLSVAEFGPDLWDRLALARNVGMPLLDVEAGGEIRLATDSTVQIDVQRGSDGGLVVSPVATIGDELLVIGGDVETIGDPPHGLWTVESDGHIRLIGLDTAVRRELVALLRSGPVAVPPQDTAEFLSSAHAKLARVVPVGSHDHSVPEPRIVLPTLRLRVDFESARHATLRWFSVYEEVEHPLGDTRPGVRDHLAEQRLLDALPVRAVDSDVIGLAVIELVDDLLPKVQNAGVEVIITGDPDIRQAEGDPIVHLTLDEDADSRDWFDLGVSITVDGMDVPFSELFTALNLDQDVLLLETGAWLRLDRPEFDRLRALIEEASGLSDRPTGDGTVRLNRLQLGLWEELVELGVVDRQADRWTQQTEQLRALIEPAAVPVPADLVATLRPYQHDGFSWLAYLHDRGLGGILADDMGLGKTLQTIALFTHAAELDPEARFLVVAPTSVVDNWRREVERFAPKLSVTTITASAKRRGTSLVDAIGETRVVVTSYALFRIEIDEYRAVDWDTFVLDEAQFVKNRRGKTYQCVRLINAGSTFAITGTPMENSLMDLWSLLSITAPGLYPDPDRFSRTYREPIESGHGHDLLTTLRRRIAPLMRRRTKDEVLTDLPAKTEQVLPVALSPRHARIYQTHLQRERQKVLRLVDDLDAHRFEVFRSLTLLRQLSLDPGLIDDEHDDVGSAKIDQLIEHLTEIIDEGHRALVFSQFTRYLGRVARRLDAEGIAHAYLDGSTRDRAAAVAKFKDGDAPVFLISLKAGGVGLNLTEADYCFVLDPWWNPAVENQAIDRAHRIGQERPVMVYRYVSADTIEEKVMALKADKQALFDSVVDADGGALSGKLSASDIRGLLG